MSDGYGQDVSDLLPAFTEWVLNTYGLRVLYTQTLKTVTAVYCDNQSRFVWKPIRVHSEEQLQMINRLLAYLQTNGLETGYMIPSHRGQLLEVLPDGSSGVLQRHVNGTHINVADRQERLSVVATIAKMHNLTGLPTGVVMPWLPHFQLAEKIVRKRVALDHIWPGAVSTFPELQTVQAQVFQGATHAVWAAHQWQLERYHVSPVNDAFCHRDLAPHNIIWMGEQSVGLIDFDLSGFDDPAMDVMQFCNHFLALATPAEGDFADIFNVYQRMSQKSLAWQKALWGVLWFPDVLLRSLVEWMRDGDTHTGRERVLDALNKERRRINLLKQDGMLIFGSSPEHGAL